MKELRILMTPRFAEVHNFDERDLIRLQLRIMFGKHGYNLYVVTVVNGVASITTNGKTISENLKIFREHTYEKFYFKVEDFDDFFVGTLMYSEDN